MAQSLLPFGTVVLISVPYFAAVIAAIIYADRLKKAGKIVEDKEDEDDKPQLGN